MNKNITKTFLVLTFVFLLIGLTAVNATQNNQTISIEDNYETSVEQDNTLINHQNTQEDTNTKNLTKTQKTNTKQETEATDTTLTLKFINNPQDELSTENYHITHPDEEYTIDITLTEDKLDTPITSKIQLYIDDINTETITLNGGHIQKTYTANSPGIQEIYAYFEGNNQYNAQTSQSIILDTEAYETTITTDEIDNQEINSTITVTGQLYYKDQEPIDNAEIIITLNSQQYTTTTDTTGKYTKTIKLENIPAQEMIKLTAQYNSPTDKYTDAENEIYFDIEKITNTITSDSIEYTVVATPIEITGQITNRQNTYQKTITARIIDTDTHTTVYTNDNIQTENGEYSFEFTPKKAGTYRLVLQAPEDENYQEAYTTQEFTTEIATLNLIVEDYYESLVKENVSITGQIVNEDDFPVENVTITISTQNTVMGSVTTDEDGRFTFTQYTFNEITEDDFLSINFKVEENENHDYIDEDVTYYLSRRNVNITLTAPETIKTGQTLYIYGKVEDSYNHSIIPDGSISLYVNDELVKSNIEIDEDGNYQTSIDTKDYTGQSQLYIEAYFIAEEKGVYYDENFEYYTVILEKTNTTLTLESTDTQVDENVNITVKLHDEYDNNLNESVQLVIKNPEDEIVYNEVLELENATKTITYTPTASGIYTIAAEYRGSDEYISSHYEIQISANKIATVISIDAVTNPALVNKTVTVTGRISDEKNNPLKLTLNLSVDGINTTIQSDEEGIFSDDITIQESKNVSIRITFPGSTKYEESSDQKSIEVHKTNTTVQIDSTDKTIRYNDTITISGQVLEENSQTTAQGQVTVYINNREIQTITLTDGHYTMNYTVNTVGECNLTVKFIENNAYSSSQNSEKINIQQRNTKIELEPLTNTTINDTITVTGRISDDRNVSIKTELTVKINDENIENVESDEEGKFRIIYKTTQIRQNTVNITFNGNTNHNASSTGATFNTNPASLKIENMTITADNRENTITVNLTIKTDAQITTENITVEIRINNQTITAKSDENATICITTEKLVPDDYNITVHINKTDYTESLTTSPVTVNIVKDNPVITLDDITGAIYSGNVTLAGKVTDSYHRPLNNTIITVKLNNNTYILETDENGYFTKTTSDFNAGINIIEATLPESAYTNTATVTKTFNADRQESRIILDETGRILPQDNMVISGVLLDKNNNLLQQKQVTIKVNNKKYVAKTDDEGRFNLTIKKAKIGSYDINASFADNNYYPSSDNMTVTVSKLQVTLVVSDVNTCVGDKIILTARLTDEKGNNVTGGNIVFKINGRTLREDDRFDSDEVAAHKFTVKDGVVQYVIDAEYYLKNACNITATYSGSYKYESAKSNVASATISHRQATITVNTKVSAKQHENITVTARITDTMNSDNSTYVDENAYVVFKLNDETVRDENHNPVKVPVINGTAVLNYSVGLMSAVDAEGNARNHTITAIYINPVYTGSIRNTTNFTVEASSVNINIYSATVKDTTLSLKAELTDYLGHNLVGTNKVCVKINGVTYKENQISKYFNITDGILDINDIYIGENVVKSVEIVTGQRQAYLGARNTTYDIRVEQ